MEKSFTPSAIRKRKWRQDFPERYLQSNRRNSWRISGIDVDEATKLWYSDRQCEICKETDKKFHIDHCHKTGKIRGLLCDTCNRGLGYFHDNPSKLRNAAQYLENSV